jgi:hypothetical protein
MSSLAASTPTDAVVVVAPLSDITNKNEESAVGAATKRSSTAAGDNGNAKVSNKKSDSEVPKSTTPYQEYLAKMKHVIQRCESRYGSRVGLMTVKDTPTKEDDDNDEEEDEDEDDNSKYTKDQMESLRFILITASQNDLMFEMRDLILGDQADSCFKMFDTSFSYHVLDTWEFAKRRLNYEPMTPTKKFDFLLAYTYTLLENRVWMHDNMGGMDELVNGLAAAWRRLLTKSSDEELRWDLEYTKPGVMELLCQFKVAIESVPDYYGMGTFRYM